VLNWFRCNVSFCHKIEIMEDTCLCFIMHYIYISWIMFYVFRDVCFFFNNSTSVFFFVMVMDLIWAIVGLKMFGGVVVVFVGVGVGVVCLGWLGDYNN
jgi:hypothetical protein